MSFRLPSSVCWRCSIRSPTSKPARSSRLSACTITSDTSQSQSQRLISTSPALWSARAAGSSVAVRPKVKAPPSPVSAPESGEAKSPKPTASPVSMTKAIAKGLRKTAPSFTETYVAYGICEQLVKECVRVADYTIPQAENLSVEIPKNEKGEDIGVGDSWWYTKLGLAPTFNTWAQITFLHMYLITVRLRGFEYSQTWHQHLTDHFFQLAEDRMVLMHRINARMIRNKYLKDLYVQWRGLNAAYDEGIIRGDAILATAVWRNIFKGDEKVDFQRLAEITCYIRSVLAHFDVMSDEVLAQGDIVFGDPSGEESTVKQLSIMTDGPSSVGYTKAPAKVITKV